MKLLLASFAVIFAHDDLFLDSPAECKQLWKRVHKKKCLIDQDECRKFYNGNKASKKFEQMAKNFCRGYKQGGNLYAGYQFFLKGGSEFCDGYMNEDDGGCAKQKHIESRFFKKAFTTAEYEKCSKFLITELCEKDINDCEGHDCQNGGICVDGIGGYSCFCRRGYEGKRCEISHSEPSESSESSEDDPCADWTAPDTCSADDISMEAVGCFCDPVTGPSVDLCAGFTAQDWCTDALTANGVSGCYCDSSTGPCAFWTPPTRCSADDIDQGNPGCACDPATGMSTYVDLCAGWTAQDSCTETQINNWEPGCYCDSSTGPCAFWTPNTTNCSADDIAQKAAGCACDPATGLSTATN